MKKEAEIEKPKTTIHSQLRIPAFLHKKLKKVISQGQLSQNQFIISAIKTAILRFELDKECL